MIRIYAWTGLLFIFSACSAHAPSRGDRRTASEDVANLLARTEIAITVDDLPGWPDDQGRMETPTEVASGVIDALKAHSVPDVYGFINASQLKDDPKSEAVLKLWRSSGFFLGNHTYTHPDLNKTSVKLYEKDILRNEPSLELFADETDWKYFRYPFLSEGENLKKKETIRKFLLGRGYKIAEVSMDFDDWAFNDAYLRCLKKRDILTAERLKEKYLDAAYRELVSSVKLSNVLFHRPVPLVLLDHMNRLNSMMFPALLDMFEKQGVKFIPMTEALKDPVYVNEPSPPYPGDGSYFEQIMAAKGLDESELGLEKVPEPSTELEKICGK